MTTPTGGAAGVTLPTPDYGHVTDEDYARVYEPSEDTFLLLDALELHAAELQDLREAVVSEIGCGVGLGLCALATLIQNGPGTLSQAIATDVNPYALEVARETGRRNQIDIETYRGDLAAAFPPELRGRLDVLLFNPPYVVTDTEEISTTSLAATWAGGAHGREVLDRLLPEIPSLLSARGRFYLIALKENLRPDTPDDLLAAIPGMRGAIVVSRKCGRERLNVVCYTRTPSS